ncbi:CUG-BP- and ETR-3-like factor [Phytophthora palmivora]|uniref:CUG-BP-and ETR-3-like factor n=1 Tax=Phytophthora palmivora TaxID=4796 RepID=A0A2P4X1N0_9STRA|nr:CUG-BP- and ETR-3-like factor [Phytophthora palmivora]
MDASPYDPEQASEPSASPEAYNEQHNGPVKLFVGQVPRTMEEDDLRPVLEVFGPLEDLVIIRDKITGAHRGCAFASYFTRDAAEKAVQELHNKVTLPQSINPLQVRPAEGQAGASQEHKLFIGMIPKTADEAAIREVFELFGTIEEVYILRHPATGQSKGCAFLKFKERSSALAAIEDVNGNVTMDRGTSPLVVKFADSRRQRLQRARNLAAAANAYWPLPPGAGLAFPQLQQLQQQYMQQMQAFGAQAAAGLNPAVAGLGSPVGAAAGSPGSPTNSFMYYNPYGFAAGAAGPYGFGGIPNVGSAGGFDMQSGLGAGLDLQGQGVEAAAKASRTTSQLEGPTGANLFIYHLPHDLTDADLATAFAPFGTVISAKVYMDKITGESKGFGFVSYDSADAADAAIASMNGFQIGTKRLKVQHKRIHQRSDYLGGGSSSSLVGHDDELAGLEYHHQGQQGIPGLDDGLHPHSDDEDEKSPSSATEGNNGVDTSLDEAVQNLRIDA